MEIGNDTDGKIKSLEKGILSARCCGTLLAKTTWVKSWEMLPNWMVKQPLSLLEVGCSCCSDLGGGPLGSSVGICKVLLPSESLKTESLIPYAKETCDFQNCCYNVDKYESFAAPSAVTETVVYVCRCFTINGNRWRSEKRYNGSPRELHVTYDAWWRFVTPQFIDYNQPGCDDGPLLIQVRFSETWRKFKEEGENLSKASQTTICEDGIREMVTFLNPKQIEDLCSP